MKKILLLLLAALWLVPGVASAHSKLETAVPEKDSTVAVSPQSIVLSYNTKIEDLSNLKLFNAAGEQIATDKAVVDDKSMSAAVQSELPSGIYTVKWTIIGADGHAVEGEYAFTVQAAEPTVAPVATDTPAATSAPTTAPTTEPSATNSPSETAAPDTGAGYEDDSGNNGGNGMTTAVIVIGAIIVIAAIVLLARRRK
ncbi:copper resistance CopC family protein [Paenibacillus harenae]|uniref:copper resistance CopC family protein n=1 Tax=Paenibacillus harenae TaxID=306543 RepID=UPI00278FB036|nr:copper resistance protein CopC [Paenibacillus harenae]MDQ0061328.1 methionine-rich copper-binding protein CopC [Paenibacillus harenae]